MYINDINIHTSIDTRYPVPPSNAVVVACAIAGAIALIVSATHRRTYMYTYHIHIETGDAYI